VRDRLVVAMGCTRSYGVVAASGGGSHGPCWVLVVVVAVVVVSWLVSMSGEYSIKSERGRSRADLWSPWVVPGRVVWWWSVVVAQMSRTKRR